MNETFTIIKDLAILATALVCAIIATWFLFAAIVTLFLPKGAEEMMRKRPQLTGWYYGNREKRKIMRDLHRTQGPKLTQIHLPPDV